MVAVDVGKGPDIGFNIIKSVFGKRAVGIISRINNGNLLYVNKEKALNYLVSTPAPIAGAADSKGPKNAIKAVKDFVNPKPSAT